ncbi:MAG: hypothetical protein K0S71_1704 [Clostridia bacterium]|jgi:hypothetical protein|nr:hypothetical protein [Clostridia bacterium]
MNQYFAKKLKAVAFFGTIGVLSFTLVAKPAMKSVKAYVNPAISYTLNGEKVLADSKTIAYDNKTYVPLADVAKILGLQTQFNNNTVTMTTSPQQITTSTTTSGTIQTNPTTTSGAFVVTPTTTGTVEIAKAIIKEVKVESKTVTIYKAGTEDKTENYTILNISDATKITSESDTKAYALADLKAGMEVSVKHSTVVSSAVPPQTEAFEIKMLAQKVEIAKAIIKEVKVESKTVTIYKEGTEDKAENYTILNISDVTKITSESDTKAYTLADLKAGMEVSVKHSTVVSSSVPPQTLAFEIKMLGQKTEEDKDDEKKETLLKDAKIIEVNNSGKYIVVQGGAQEGGQLKISFGNKTKVKYEGAKKQPNANSLKAGQIADIKFETAEGKSTILEIIVKESKTVAKENKVVVKQNKAATTINENETTVNGNKNKAKNK